MWYKADIPKVARAYIRQLATEQLGMRYRLPFPNQSNRNKKKKKMYGSRRGKWIYERGYFYFQKEELARQFEQEVTAHFLSKPN